MTKPNRETQLLTLLLRSQKSLRWALSRLDDMTEGEDEDNYAEAKATVEAVEKYERDVEAGSK